MSASDSLELVAVDFNSRAMNDFIHLPWKIQQDDPYWVPPLLIQIKHVLNPKKGPFFEFGTAQYFLVYKNGEAVGRISAHVNKMHDERYNDATGFFGFFECIDDQEAANVLLDAAADWLRKRGKKRILGPLSFGIYDEVGILVDGFDSMPAIMQTHNPPYYGALVENWGGAKAFDWLAKRILERNVDVEGMQKKLDDIVAKNNLTLTSPKPSDVVKRKDEVYKLFNESWDANWGHVPFTKKQWETIISDLKPLLRTDLMRLFLTQEGDIAAFLITIPDLNPTIKELNGKLGLLGIPKLYFAARYRPLKKLRTVLLGVRRDYQRKMLHYALILSSYLDFIKNPSLEVCDCSLIPENLKLYRRMLRGFGANVYKTWRLYDREI